MNVYIVFKDKGQYEDNVQIIKKVFIDKNLAKTYCDRLNHKLKKLKDILKEEPVREGFPFTDRYYDLWNRWVSINEIHFYYLEEHEITEKL